MVCFSLIYGLFFGQAPSEEITPEHKPRPSRPEEAG